MNTDSFIRLVKKYTDVQELNAEIIREFIDKVYIYKAERIGGKKVQHIKILLWNRHSVVLLYFRYVKGTAKKLSPIYNTCKL